MDEVVVTVICFAYNHEAYIREALEGFVAQRPGFPFEVIVHDDASTDGTAEVIREYARRYPDLFRPVFQTENQFSKGVDIAQAFLFPLVRGRYVALCEGDDRWTDPLKLRRQVEALEANPDIDLCAHRSAVIRGGRHTRDIAPRQRDCIIPVESVILGGGVFVATSSLLCRRECYLEMTPFRKVLMNDYTLQIQGSLRSGMLYLSRCMSIYRKGVPNSWTALHKGLPRDAQKRMLAVLDRFTEGRYHKAVTLRQRLYDAKGLRKAVLSLWKEITSRFRPCGRARAYPG